MKKVLKTSIDAQEDIKAILDSTSLPSMISGQIRQNMRVLNSTKEDVTIGTLLWDGAQIQSGVIIINVHVPNLAGQYGEGGSIMDKTQPNIPRLKEIGSVIASALDFYEGIDFSLRLRNPGHLESFGSEWIYAIEVNYIFLRRDVL